jgi:hypothetical protein
MNKLLPVAVGREKATTTRGEGEGSFRAGACSDSRRRKKQFSLRFSCVQALKFPPSACIHFWTLELRSGRPWLYKHVIILLLTSQRKHISDVIARRSSVARRELESSPRNDPCTKNKIIIFPCSSRTGVMQVNCCSKSTKRAGSVFTKLPKWSVLCDTDDAPTSQPLRARALRVMKRALVFAPRKIIINKKQPPPNSFPSTSRQIESPFPPTHILLNEDEC